MAHFKKVDFPISVKNKFINWSFLEMHKKTLRCVVTPEQANAQPGKSL